jgi:hypothetical protein
LPTLDLVADWITAMSRKPRVPLSNSLGVGGTGSEGSRLSARSRAAARTADRLCRVAARLRRSHITPYGLGTSQQTCASVSRVRQKSFLSLRSRAALAQQCSAPGPDEAIKAEMVLHCCSSAIVLLVQPLIPPPISQPRASRSVVEAPPNLT